MEQKKINIAELLKDCPKGMELYSTIYGTVYFEGVRDTGNAVLIDVKTSCNTEVQFYPDGKLNTYYSDSEMTLFPSKDVRNWEGFQRPFKDGDIIANGYFDAICIFKDEGIIKGTVDFYCGISGISGSDELVIKDVKNQDKHFGYINEYNLATEEEKQKLFDAIKANGYKWNAETKTLEKLIEPKFKVGDMIQDVDKYKVRITEVNLEDECYGYESMIAKGIGAIPFKEQNNWELVPNKFDITTLKPFKSEVLVRTNNGKWTAAFYSHYDEDSSLHYCVVGGLWYAQCIPYKGNRHLLGTTDDCDEFYKNWEQ